MIVYILRAVLARFAFLFHLSFKQERYNDWRNDTGIEQLLLSVIPARVVEEMKKAQVYGLERAIEHLENEFVTEAQMNKR